MKFMQEVLNGLRPAVVGLVAYAGASILLLALFRSGTTALSSVNWQNAALVLTGIAALRILDLNPAWIIAAFGMAGIVFYLQQSLMAPWKIAIDAAMLMLLAGIGWIKVSQRRRKARTDADGLPTWLAWEFIRAKIRMADIAYKG